MDKPKPIIKDQKNEINKDILWVLNDILEEDIPFWDLDGDEEDNITGEQVKEWYKDCMQKAIEIIKNSLQRNYIECSCGAHYKPLEIHRKEDYTVAKYICLFCGHPIFIIGNKNIVDSFWS